MQSLAILQHQQRSSTTGKNAADKRSGDKHIMIRLKRAKKNGGTR